MRGLGILINDNYELQVNNIRNANGQLDGFKIGKTIHQNAAVILIHEPGQIKEALTLGVGIENMVMDNDMLGWKRKIRLALEQDEQIVESINISDNNLEINAKY